MKEKYLYVILASTPYRIGRIIRRFTGEKYNHVAVSLDESLTPMYGFARRYYRTPLYGGFVKESLSRYRVHGQVTDIKICRLPVTDEQYRRLRDLFAQMYAQKEHYLYNHFSVVTACFGRLAPAKDAYICVEFGVHILQQIGIDVDPKKYYSVGAVEQLLKEYVVYTGPIPEGAYDDNYYAKKPVSHPFLTTVRDIFALIPRLGR